jgi:hypothetical protein
MTKWKKSVLLRDSLQVDIDTSSCRFQENHSPARYFASIVLAEESKGAGILGYTSSTLCNITSRSFSFLLSLDQDWKPGTNLHNEQSSLLALALDNSWQISWLGKVGGGTGEVTTGWKPTASSSRNMQSKAVSAEGDHDAHKLTISVPIASAKIVSRVKNKGVGTAAAAAAALSYFPMLTLDF